MARLPLAVAVATYAVFVASPGVTAQSLAVEAFAGGFDFPLYATSPPGDLDRVFVVEKAGVIRIVRSGAVLPTPFLDIRPLVDDLGERGLLGLAFHPDYGQNGRFFVDYTNTNGNTRVVEYVASANPDVADPNPVQELLAVHQPGWNHNGGGIQFGADGKLWVGMGDGGGPAPAQDTTKNLGKMLRLDVDLPPPFIPPDNPFVGVPGTNDEIWAIGLRNPWRWSFDRETGDLWIADVGSGFREEIDFAPASSTGGENWGWPCKEGTYCTGWGPCDCAAVLDPVHDFASGQVGCAIVGGYVYRGASMPALRGTYFYGDFCLGRVWTFRLEGDEVIDHRERTDELAGIERVASFGEDARGELLVCDSSAGVVWKIVRACGAAKYCPAVPNSTGERASLELRGSPSVAANDVELWTYGLPANRPGYYLMSAGIDYVPFLAGGDGNLCLAAPIARFASDVVGSGQHGIIAFAPDLSNLPSGVVVQAGETWRFQLWYRDANPAPTSNTSDGSSILFCP